MKLKNDFKTTLAALVGLALVSAPAQAALTQIGPGADLAGASVGDTAGQERQNVALSSSGDDFVNFAAGTYSVRDFQLNVFNHVGTGTIAPMLLTGSSGSWTTLWVGDDFDPSSNGAQTAAVYGAGVETFTLASATDVWEGGHKDYFLSSLSVCASHTCKESSMEV